MNRTFLFSARTRTVSLGMGLVLLGALPLAMVLPGCGGGSSSGSLKRNVLNNARLALSRQPVFLTLDVNGASMTGTLVVPDIGAARAASPDGAATNDFTFDLPRGTSTNVKGQFFSPTGFNVSSNFSGLGDFVIKGNLPANGNAGNYTFSLNGQEESGVFDLSSVPTPTPGGRATATPVASATPVGTATPTPVPTNAPSSLNLTIGGASADFTGNVAPLTPLNFTNGNLTLSAASSSFTADLQSGGTSLLNGSAANVGRDFKISFSTNGPFSAGQRIANRQGAGGFNVLRYDEYADATGVPVRSYVSMENADAAITIGAVSATSITVNFTNLMMKGNDAADLRPTPGTFTFVSGSLTFSTPTTARAHSSR